MAPEQLINAQECADVLGIHVDSLWRMIRKGTAPPVVRLGAGRNIRFSPTALQEWIARGGSSGHANGEANDAA